MVSDEWTERARSFGRVAGRYDRVRPGYPGPLYDEVLALTPGRRVLDVGAGTGRATLELARRGATVVAVEPDPEMAAVLRERAEGLPVEVAGHRFEEHDGDGVDLVVAGQAWHWVDPEVGPAVAARLLRPGGALAVWWNRSGPLTGPAWDALDAVYARHAPDLSRHRPAHTHAHVPEAGESVDPAPGFTPWTTSVHAWTARYDADGYVALLGTFSDHLRLPDAARERLLAAVHDAVAGSPGGRLEHPYRTLLLHARPVGS